jgi:hypothetical protein
MMYPKPYHLPLVWLLFTAVEVFCKEFATLRSLLRPFRHAAGLRAPGVDLDGWYTNARFGPEAFGQWISALSRYAAITGDTATREKVVRLA